MTCIEFHGWTMTTHRWIGHHSAMKATLKDGNDRKKVRIGAKAVAKVTTSRIV